MSTSVELRRDSGRYSPSQGPWVPRSWVSKVLGNSDPAEPAPLLSPRGERLAWGLVDAQSPIAFRVLSWGETPPCIDWIERRLHNALELRRRMGLAPETNGYRLVHSDHDGLPGLTIDRYDDLLRIQCSHRAAQAMLPRVQQWLLAQGAETLVLDPTPSELDEGSPEDRALRTHDGDHAPAELRYQENGIEIAVPSLSGPAGDGMHAYRPLREKAARLALAQGGAVLDLGCHLGGFSLHAARHGLPVFGVDRDAIRLQYALQNARKLGLDNISWIRGDMFEVLSRPPLDGPFGLVILDHPEAPRTARDLRKSVPRLAQLLFDLMPKVERGGHLVLCSDSPRLNDENVDRLVLEASHAHPPRAQVWSRVARWDCGPDHPQSLCHPEAHQLRALVYQRR